MRGRVCQGEGRRRRRVGPDRDSHVRTGELGEYDACARHPAASKDSNGAHQSSVARRHPHPSSTSIYNFDVSTAPFLSRPFPASSPLPSAHSQCPPQPLERSPRWKATARNSRTTPSSSVTPRSIPACGPGTNPLAVLGASGDLAKKKVSAQLAALAQRIPMRPSRHSPLSSASIAMASSRATCTSSAMRAQRWTRPSSTNAPPPRDSEECGEKAESKTDDPEDIDVNSKWTGSERTGDISQK